MAISKFAPLEVGSLVIPEKKLYIALGIIGLPMLFIASPLSVLFWLVASSVMLILFHAMLMEPGLESEYGEVETV
ncbi:ER to transport-related protein [Trichosporon asahii var. asahii CBS 8904]|uniref:PRA1 family protein n=2 Tax=Trichosporon asahii var. asahii TaxID=189963 RepID=K1WG29_TRIAC|nr:ER to transport-related protein [Trichosporon asahii var. asahii CBS 8904]